MVVVYYLHSGSLPEVALQIEVEVNCLLIVCMLHTTWNNIDFVIVTGSGSLGKPPRIIPVERDTGFELIHRLVSVSAKYRRIGSITTGCSI